MWSKHQKVNECLESSSKGPRGKIERVGSFKYLGVRRTSNGGSTDELKSK